MGQHTVKSLSKYLAACASMLLMAGCGNSSSIDLRPNTVVAPLSGVLHGGPSPIIGATVTLYATQSNGYGGAALQLGNTATTDSNGAFNFSNPTAYVCPSGQFAYITATGGNSGGNTTNNQIVFVAAIGPCANLSTSTTTWIDELTTVAAAYALGNFTTITGSGAATVVNISAPAGNNSATPCVAQRGTCVATQMAGLGHAFATALNLVNTTNGQAYATLPTQSVATSGVPAVTPSVEINTLGNIMQTCVNSIGGTAGDGSGCGLLFKDTTPPNGTAPANTLQAMLNLAKYPSLGTSETLATYNATTGGGPNIAVAAIFNLAPSASFYQPALTAAPPDWALSIVYPPGNGGTTPANNLTYPYLLALDIADNVYVLNTSATVTEQNLIAWQNNGTPLWQNAPDATSFPNPRGMALDAVGNIWTSQYNGTNAGLVQYSQATGAFIKNIAQSGGNPAGVIVDPSNNVYLGFGQASVTTQAIYEYLYANGYKQPTYTVVPKTSTGIYQFAFDSSMNLWASGFNNAGVGTTTAYVLPNTGTVSGPVYYGTAVVPTTFTGYYSYGIALDAAGVNAYTTDSSGVYKLTPSGSGSSLTVSAGTAVPLISSAPPYEVITDGAGSMWIPAQSTSATVGLPLEQFSTSTQKIAASINSCYVPTGTKCITTAAAGVYPPIYAGRSVAVDASGNIWFTNNIGGELTEVVGLGAPTTPQISAAQFGLAGVSSTTAGNAVPQLNTSSLTFGSVVSGNGSTQTVTLSDLSSAPLSISNIALSGAGAASYNESDNCGTQIPGNHSCTITITFNPVAFGSQPATLTVADGAPSSPPPVTLTGTGTTATSATGTVNLGTTTQVFEGWGTSLAGWANVVGGFPDPIRDNYITQFFDPVNGLGLNIVRYQIGGGENPAYLPPNNTYLAYRSRIPGFEPSLGVYDWTQDANQRWVLQQAIAKGVNIAEAFSNSPPYWMTNSGSSTGGVSGADNLSSANYNNFADYLTTVVKYYHDHFGVTFRTVDALNEPSATYWDFGGPQEACGNINPANQDLIIKALGASLANKGMTYTTVSSSDENTINEEVTTLSALDSTALGYMSQVNTHGYSGTQRAQLYAAATADSKRLWMSEYGDNDGTGMKMATEIVNDLTTMYAKAWVYWQTIDSATGWGFMLNPLNSETNYTSTFNQKYYVMANFTKFIRPGYQIVTMSDPQSVAAYDGVGTVSIVTVASASVTETYSIANLGSGTWTVTPYQTSSSENMVALAPFQLTGSQFTYSMPASSVTTFVVTKTGP